MEFKTLEKTEISVILAAFNLSFSDYFVPFHLSKKQLVSKIKSEKTDLAYSIGVFEDGVLVGFILHGYGMISGQHVLYNGGTGVIPNARGKGLTKQMYKYLFQQLKIRNIDYIILEVVSENRPAIKSYKKVGFKITRELRCYKGKIADLKINTELIIKELDNYPWSKLESFWEIHPTWQTSKNALNNSGKENSSFGAYLKDELVGYVIFNSAKRRIHQLAVKKTKRRMKIASTLINKMVSLYGNEISIINIDTADLSLSSFFKSHGLENYLDQYEMKLEMNNYKYQIKI